MEATAGSREILYYAALLPAIVRIALETGDRELGERLASGVQRGYPYAEHALSAANAALAEARGDLQAAADAYAEAADRWERFGVVPEHAFALLGQGRCLVGLGRTIEAAPVLRRAREIFDALGAVPSLAETDVLLRQAAALSS
jgi:tetratricopeptide (TPR) repeat protein